MMLHGLTRSTTAKCIPRGRRRTGALPKALRGVRAFALRPENLFFDEEPPDECLVFLLKGGRVMQIPARVRAQDLRTPIQRILEKYPVPVAEEQGLCVAGTFWVAASNGVDPKRRIHFQGFCQSPEALGECVEDVVLDRGGEVVHQQHITKDDGLHRRLQMTVAVPYLFGVPPELETLKSAIELGGGLLHRVYGQWYFY